MGYGFLTLQRLLVLLLLLAAHHSGFLALAFFRHA